MTSDYREWIGRSEQVADVIGPARTNALSAALGRAEAIGEGASLPLLHHWLYFWDVRGPAGLGPDGHPMRGGFLPPVALPRRMWAGGRIAFLRPLTVGERATRTSTIRRVEAKSGRSGELVFVTVEHAIADEGGVAVREEQELVYRGAAAATAEPAPAPTPAAPPAAWADTTLPDPVLLFRYSALTMNGHRIHYDRDYATREEAYPGLVVHGPLQATLLLALAASRLDRPVTGFQFRSHAPAFDGTALHACGEPTVDGASLWTEQGGRRNMVATASCGIVG